MLKPALIVSAVILLLDLIVIGVLRSGVEVWHLGYVTNVISGLAVGQVILAAVWLALRREHGVATLLIFMGALLMGSLIRDQLGFFAGFGFFDYFARNALQGLACLLPLWLLVRTPLWRRFTRDNETKPLQFGFKEMFFWTTCAAVFATLLGRAGWANGQPLAIQFWTGLIAPALVGWGVTLASQIPIPLLIRGCLHLAVGALVGVTLARMGGRPIERILAVEFGSQAAVIAAGVELTHSKRHTHRESADGRNASQA